MRSASQSRINLRAFPRCVYVVRNTNGYDSSQTRHDENLIGTAARPAFRQLHKACPMPVPKLAWLKPIKLALKSALTKFNVGRCLAA